MCDSLIFCRVQIQNTNSSIIVPHYLPPVLLYLPHVDGSISKNFFILKILFVELDSVLTI